MARRGDDLMTHRPSPPLALLDRAALLLDFDGTLVELAPEPDDVVIPETLLARLDALADWLEGRLAIVSGRDVATLAGFGLGHLTLVGSHGAEVRPAGGADDLVAPLPDFSGIARQLHDFAACRPGVIVETKTHGMALHYRQVPQWEEEALALARLLARETGLFVQKGKMMVELRSGEADKGVAIALLMESAPFIGHRPVFLGDDLTDECGFATVATLGGAGILVGPERDSRATYRLTSVEAVHAWLDAVMA